ncbi:MAG TPA: 4-hydroxythreonine-4-phosphate dehydrogenase PdxA [Chloroflexi bacterium]|nr:4-hydroxythreonine-4-phosphate dehydrogenase PdxA [Chloroflexota bacterium]
MTPLPIVAITSGDPAGVGPEIVVKALARREVRDCCRPLAIGDARVIAQAAALTDSPPVFHAITDVTAARFDADAIDILDLKNVDPEACPPAQVSAAAGRAAVDYIERAVELARAGQVDGIVTGPINKAALQAAGVPYIGHTELLAALTGTDEMDVTTMLATPGLRVVHVTRHLPLREVAAHITLQRVLATIRLTHAGLQHLGFPAPRLAVAALNPHGGDGGLLGREEIEAIGPAVEAARAESIAAHGPIPADSVFFRAIRGEFDAVVAMYHDQGHIPIKTHGFERSVTVTLGLPLVRTSVDHGTAFDIAWRGQASAESLEEAIRLAAQLTRRAGFASLHVVWYK